MQLYRVHMGKSMPQTHHVKPRYEYNFRIYIYNRIDAIAPTRIWTSLPKNSMSNHATTTSEFIYMRYHCDILHAVQAWNTLRVHRARNTSKTGYRTQYTVKTFNLPGTQ